MHSNELLMWLMWAVDNADKLLFSAVVYGVVIFFVIKAMRLK